MRFGGVQVERWGALLLLTVSGAGTWLLSQQAVEVANATSVREEQIEHLVTLVGMRAGNLAPEPAPLRSLEGLFEGQRLDWLETPTGRILTLHAVDAGGGPR